MKFAVKAFCNYGLFTICFYAKETTVTNYEQTRSTVVEISCSVHQLSKSLVVSNVLQGAVYMEGGRSVLALGRS